MPNQSSARASRSRASAVVHRRPVAAAALVTVLLAACGGGGDSPQAPPASSAPQPTSPVAPAPEGGAGTGDRLSTYGTASLRTEIRKLLALKVFKVPLTLVDVLTNYNYNDFGQSPGCGEGKGGYAGGHSGIDLQTKSVAGQATADEPVFAIAPGTFIGYRTNSWGITAVFRASARNAVTGEVADIYVHLLHLREINPDLLPGQPIVAGTYIGIQGSAKASAPNEAEHVHVEIGRIELAPARGAHPEDCGYTEGAAEDPYVWLESLLSDEVNRPPELTLGEVSTSPMSVGNIFTLSATVNEKGYATLTWNDGAREVQEVPSTGGNVMFTRTMNVPGSSLSWTLVAVDEVGSQSAPITGSVYVIASAPTPAPPVANVRPTVTKTDDGPNTATVGEEWTIRARGEDEEGQLVRIDILWSDGVSESRSADGSTESERFNRTFQSTGNFTYTITATDASGATGTLSGSVTVEAEDDPDPEPNPIVTGPRITDIVATLGAYSDSFPRWIQLYGENFHADAVVHFRAPSDSANTWTRCCSSAVPVILSTVISVKPMFNEAGTWDVRVTNPDGRIADATINVSRP